MALDLDLSSTAYHQSTMRNWFDPLKSEQLFNSAQAATDRQFNAEQAQLTRDFNSQEAQKQRDYETAMSNTAYQRAAEDMRKAGLNPYLAYNNGGASTPTAYAASASNASAGSGARSGSGRGGALGSLVNDAVSLAKAFIYSSARIDDD